MIGQLPAPPRRTKSSPERQAAASTPRNWDTIARLEDEKAALAAELATVQGRLHDALEVLEGVLAERSTLLKQTHELQGQLAAALAQQHGGQTDGGSGAAAGSAQTPEAGVEKQAGTTPTRVLRQELLLAQSQLAELRQAQQAWEAERQALLSDVEEERARLQEGLAQALTQATCAQREADVAAERAAHWCALADVLQRSALLPEGPASPAGGAGTSVSATPASGRSAGTHASSVPSSVLSSSSAPCSLSRAQGPDAARSAARMLAEWRPASAARQPARRAAGGHHAAASGGGSPQGPGLLKAFQAVAEERAPPSPEALGPAAAPMASAAPAADAHVTKLRLKRLDTSPPSTGGAGHGPLTPLPHMALPGAAAATPASTASGSSAQAASTGAARTPRTAGRGGLLGRLASLTACGAGLAAPRIK